MSENELFGSLVEVTFLRLAAPVPFSGSHESPNTFHSFA